MSPHLPGEISKKYPCPACGEENSTEREFCWKCFQRLSSKEEARRTDINRRAAEELGDKPPAAAKPVPWARAAGALALGAITLRLLLAGEPAFIPILDHVNLAFHEAGHIIFGPFGEFMQSLGGTLSQLLWPLVCLVHFRRRGDGVSADICLWWTGENLLNISFYAADAIRQELPLVGGGVHDWTYLLTATGLIAKTDLVGRTLALAGACLCFWAIYRMIMKKGEVPGSED